MAEKTRCEICNMTFKDENGLAQHKLAKHPIEEKKPIINTKKIRNWTTLIVIIALFLAGLGWVISSTFKGINSCKTDPIAEINIVDHQNAKLHIHADLNIIIDGEYHAIPANIGISPGVMRPMHTHAPDNEIHIEGPCQRDFKLADFFAIWGKEFNSQCIFDKCTNDGTLTMKVNGIPNSELENYVIKDHDDIVIEYKSN